MNQSSTGYYIDIFFLEKDIKTIERKTVLIALQRAIKEANLKFYNEVPKHEFMQKTKSAKEMNRYIVLPTNLLKNIDNRTTAKSTLDLLVEDYKTDRPVIGEGISLEKSFSYNNLFHDPRYVSCNLIGMDLVFPDGSIKKYTIVKVAFNVKILQLAKHVQNLAPVVDVTAFTGIILTRLYNSSGIYARAGSFSISEELLLFYYHGEKKDEKSGRGTLMKHGMPESEIEKIYNIDLDKVNRYIDNQISIHYAPDDLKDIEAERNRLFILYGIHRQEIISKLNTFITKWFNELEILRDKQSNSREKDFLEMLNLEYQNHINILRNLIKQMLIKESSLDEDIKNEKDKIDNNEGDKTNPGSRLFTIVQGLTDVLIAQTAISKLLNNDSNIIDIYFKIDFA